MLQFGQELMVGKKRRRHRSNLRRVHQIAVVSVHAAKLEHCQVIIWVERERFKIGLYRGCGVRDERTHLRQEMNSAFSRR